MNFAFTIIVSGLVAWPSVLGSQRRAIRQYADTASPLYEHG